MLVPVTFILIRIWGTLRFILYTFAGVHSLNTTYGTVFLYLQVSLLWCAAQCDFFLDWCGGQSYYLLCSNFVKMSMTIKITRHSRELDSRVGTRHPWSPVSLTPLPDSRNIDKKTPLPFGFTLSIGNPSINQSMLLIHSQQLNDLLLHLTHDNHFVLTLNNVAQSPSKDGCKGDTR